MARTRQKRKAKQREQQLKATRQSAAAKETPMNPAEQAVIDQAEALEIADELEAQIEADTPAAEAPPEPPPAKERPKRQERKREAKKPERRPQPKPSRRESGQRGRVANFLVQVWAELRRVQWPDRNQVTQATGVVVVFCFLAGAYLALWDFVWNKLITWLL
jgi:preprotein translocase SecE subunit